VTNSFSAQDDAAAYALDILAEQAEFERELAESEALRSEVAAFQSVVGYLAYGVPMEPLPAGLKDKLFSRLDLVAAQPANLLDLMDWPMADLQRVAIDLPNWEPFPLPSGSMHVIWQVDELNAQVAFFLRVPGAGMLPKHWHAAGESILVLEGNFIDDDGTVFEVGDRSVAAANTSHQPSTSLGCLILNVTSMHDKILVTT
jgi:anti-sigma factor ChrR (cupin superfamily)